jgi:KaiC/GvpD/RAD55 family RecA-like ATPase
VFGSSSKDDSQREKEKQNAAAAIAGNSTAAVSEIPTGIPGFDDLMGQGLPTGNIYLLSGSYNSNVAMFAQQVLYNVLLRKSKAAYFTVEKQGFDIMDDMSVYQMNIEKYIDDGSWVFVRAIPPSLRKISDSLPDHPMEQKVDLHDSLAPLMDQFLSLVKEGRSTAMHLNSLVRSYSLDELQSLLLYMTATARKFGGVHFIILTEGTADQNVLTTIKDIADAVYELSTESRGTEIETVVTIQKVRKIIPRTRLIRLAVRKDGLATETIRRIG